MRCGRDELAPKLMHHVESAPGDQRDVMRFVLGHRIDRRQPVHTADVGSLDEGRARGVPISNRREKP